MLLESILKTDLLVRCAGLHLMGGLCANVHPPQMRLLPFLNRTLSTNSENAVTPHSLKHTTPSWCAAYGLDEPSRTLLGHHELQGAKAMTVYSRDLLTRPLQLYCSMLESVHCDHFKPDESRTSRMVDL